MGVCFVIQPFDRGAFDKRYEDVFAPSIKAAGLEPYRVDQDPSVSIPIDEIQSGIQAADLCLVEITTNNPNVWFELGFAIASYKEVVLVCSSERKEKYPFDIQHRSIINYNVESSSDYVLLGEQITKRIGAILKKKEALGSLVEFAPIAETEGLNQHELAALVTIAENVHSVKSKAAAYGIREDMNRAGFNRLAVTLSLAMLERKGLIDESYDQDYNGEEYASYGITPRGLDWLLQNQNLLNFRKQKHEIEIVTKESSMDDIPF